MYKYLLILRYSLFEVHIDSKACNDDCPPAQVSTDAAQKFSLPCNDSRLQSEHAVSPPCCEYWLLLLVLREWNVNTSVTLLPYMVDNVELLCYNMQFKKYLCCTTWAKSRITKIVKLNEEIRIVLLLFIYFGHCNRKMNMFIVLCILFKIEMRFLVTVSWNMCNPEFFRIYAPLNYKYLFCVANQK